MIHSTEIARARLQLQARVGDIVREIKGPWASVANISDALWLSYHSAIDGFQEAIETAVREESAPIIWTTLEGRRIALPDLTNDHLQNIIYHLRGRGSQGTEIYQEMINEANKRGLKETVYKAWT